MIDIRDIKLNVKTLARYKDMSISELAEKCEISQEHLKWVSLGKVKMTAEDLQKLSAFTEIPMENIKA